MPVEHFKSDQQWRINKLGHNHERSIHLQELKRIYQRGKLLSFDLIERLIFQKLFQPQNFGNNSPKGSQKEDKTPKDTKPLTQQKVKQKPTARMSTSKPS